MRWIKKIIGAILTTIIILIVTLNVYNFINIKVLNKDLSSLFGYSMLEVVSGSMEPTIKVGEIIVIDTDAKEYNKGDIVTFYDTNGSFVTHRIVKIDEDQMVTKGDNNKSKDEPIDTKNIVGKYVYKFSHLSMIISFFKNPIVLILILVIGILYSYLSSEKEKIQNKKDTPRNRRRSHKQEKLNNKKNRKKNNERK